MGARETAALALLFSLSLAGCGGGDPPAATRAAAATSGNDSGAARCDRDCLIELTKSYLAAVVAGDPAAVPLADDVAFVENVMRLNPGEGLWANATSGPASFAIYVPDVEQQQAGFMGVMEREDGNGNQPVLVAVRVKLEDGEISEAEHIVANVSPNNMQRLQIPRAGLLAEVPVASRQSYEDLVEIGLSYYDALDDNDGSPTGWE